MSAEFIQNSSAPAELLPICKIKVLCPALCALTTDLYKVPFVDNTSVIRSSYMVAISSALANALNMASMI